MDATETGRAEKQAVPSGEHHTAVELVTTKLAPPASLPCLLPRQKLVARLVTGHGGFSLISATAGWGKSSLLNAWHHSDDEQRRFAFVHLDAGDDNCQTFWTYVLASLRTIRPGIVADADVALRAPGVMPLRTIVPALINEMSQSDVSIVLVLDDYHVITDADIHRSVLYLIDHLPPSLHLAIASRSDPPFPLGKLRASGALTEIRAGQLGFTQDEAKQFTDQHFDLQLDEHSLHLLCQRTEGWAAGIHLAALSLQGESDHRGFIERFAGDDRNITDYLTTEVLDQLPAERKAFLLHTSVLDDLTGPLCDAVTGTDDSGATLEDLERRNLFLIPLDNRRKRYRYHHLFVEWLRHELHKREPEIIPDLHERAARWFAENGSDAQAITHAIAAGHHERAADLMNRYLADWEKINWPSAMKWLAQVPDEIQRRRPMVAVARIAMAATVGDIAEGRRWLQAAESTIEESPDDLRPTIRMTMALFEAISELQTGDLEVALGAFTAIAEKTRPTGSGVFALAIGMVGTVSFWIRDPLTAIPALQEGAVAQQRLSMVDVGVTGTLAMAYAEIGDWLAAESTAKAALEIPCPSAHYRYPDAMGAHYALAMRLTADGKHDEAASQIKQGLDMARRWVEPAFVVYGCLLLSDALRDYNEKRALVREARRLITGGRIQGRLIGMVASAERKLSIRSRSLSDARAETLTDRERDVVRLLRSDLSLREIADELYVSYNTIKSYTKSVYRKLGVSSRSAAIETARDLDIA